MNVHRVIIHELEKEAQSTELTYKSSNNLLEINDGITALITQIHTSFEKSLSKYAKFDLDNESNSVYRNINRYLDTNEDGVFITFSKASLDDLASRIEREPFATGGYYLFIDYEEANYRYISIVIVRNKEAFNIQWRRNNFMVDETENINIDKIAMGFRLNCNLYTRNGDDRNYLALVSNQGDELSKYFLRWVNAKGVITSKVNTKTLVNIIKDLGSPDPSTSQDDFERIVYDWISGYKRENENKVDVDGLSNYLYDNPLRIREYAMNTLQKEIDPLFKVNPEELKRLIRLRASVKGISVAIDTEKFDDNEVYIADGALVIRNSQIVQSLESQRNNEI